MEMETFSHVPPGFRFHPTDEELVDYYLRKKIASRRIDLDVIKEVDLYKIEPWDLQELCKIGTEEQNDWYFFSHKDKKYPTGTRTNRATKAGFWKATGRDKAIYSKQHNLIGMRKTLVFYQGRAPNGQKSDWIIHEYRLETKENGTTQEEGWAVCRVFKKKMPTTVRKMSDQGSPFWYDDQVPFMPDLDSFCRQQQITQPYTTTTTNAATSFLLEHQYLSCKQELELEQHCNVPREDIFHQLPLLESPKESKELQKTQKDDILCSSANNEQSEGDQLTDWRVLDKFVATQFSQEDGSSSFQEGNYDNSNLFQDDAHASSSYYASMSNTNCLNIDDMWK